MMARIQRLVRGAFVALVHVCVCAAAGAQTGAVTQSIEVRVNLLTIPSGQCTSQSLSQQTNATVTVTCSTNEFVSIEAIPGKPYVFTHGGAHRWLPRSASQMAGEGISQAGIWREGSWGIGAGTITGLRVLRVSDAQEPLELLVSF
jgi:hypothetical protein